MKTGLNRPDEFPVGDEAASSRTEKPDLQDPAAVLSVLEADQVVAAKRQMRFGRRKLSLGTRLLFWGLRVYVVVMLVIVLLSVLHALHGAS